MEDRILKIRTCIYKPSSAVEVNMCRDACIFLISHEFCPPKKRPACFLGLLFLSNEVGWFCSHFPGWLGLSIAKVLSSSLPIVPPSDALGLARPSPSPQEYRQMDRIITWSLTSSCPILSNCRNTGPPQPLWKAGQFEVAWVQSPASFLLPGKFVAKIPTQIEGMMEHKHSTPLNSQFNPLSFDSDFFERFQFQIFLPIGGSSRMPHHHCEDSADSAEQVSLVQGSSWKSYSLYVYLKIYLWYSYIAIFYIYNICMNKNVLPH